MFVCSFMGDLRKAGCSHLVLLKENDGTLCLGHLFHGFADNAYIC